MAYEVILEPGTIGQFREFESPRVHSTRINSWGVFLVHKLREARERELATLDEKSTSSSGIAEPYAR